MRSKKKVHALLVRTFWWRHFGVPSSLMFFFKKVGQIWWAIFFTSIPSISATSINFSEKWRSQKRSNLRVGPKIEKIVKVFVMELIHEFWFSLKTIFQFLHKKITSKFAIFAIVGLAKKVSHDHGYSKMMFSKSVQKRSKSHCLCSKSLFLWA